MPDDLFSWAGDVGGSYVQGPVSRRGRPVWRPTQAQRGQVVTMAVTGARQIEIAKALGVSVPTVRKHCATELKTGETPRARRRVLSTVPADRRRTREILDAVNGIETQIRLQNARLAKIEHQRQAEREHGPIILRKLTELERLVRADPGLARAPRPSRRQPLGGHDA
jgi:predicted transcriptional regulator